MEISKILKGLFIKDGQAGMGGKSGIRKQIDAKDISPVLFSGLRSNSGGNEISAISSFIDATGYNRAAVNVLCPPADHQSMISFTYDNAHGAGPSSHQVYTVTAGKTLYVSAIFMMNWTGSLGWDKLSDGIADGGTVKFSAIYGAYGSASFNSACPIAFTQGIRVDAANCNANGETQITIVGWEE
jgi:hypothetical protein